MADRQIRSTQSLAMAGGQRATAYQDLAGDGDPETPAAGVGDGVIGGEEERRIGLGL